MHIIRTWADLPSVCRVDKTIIYVASEQQYYQYEDDKWHDHLLMNSFLPEMIAIDQKIKEIAKTIFKPEE